MLEKMGKTIFRFIDRNSSTILASLGCVGVIATAVSAVKATPDACLLIREENREKHDGDPYGGTKLDAVKACWKCYIPAAIIGVSTITCIVGANILDKKKQGALISAYTLINESYKKYRKKVIDIYGEDADKNIINAIVRDKEGPSFEQENKDERLFFDYFSDRYFQSTMENVQQAEYELNRMYATTGQVSLNDFYKLLGIEETSEGVVLGWDVNIGAQVDAEIWIDFDHELTTLDDGLECYILTIPTSPTPIDRDYH